MQRFYLTLLLLASTGATSVLADETLWFGTIDAGVIKLRVLVRLERMEESLKGTFSSIDQSKQQSALSDVTFAAGKLTFQVKEIRSSYEGTVNGETGVIEGQWTQSGQKLKLDLKKITELPPRQLESVWAGNLDAGGAKLLLAFRIFDDKGKKDAVFNSPKQTAQDFPATVKIDGKNLSLEVPSLGAKFEGTLSDDGSKVEGTWIQSGQRFPMTFGQNLKEITQDAAVNRPQMPKPPFDYRSIDVQFANIDADVKLAGTLTIPQATGSYPAAIMITGSGPQDRDESLFGHKPFLVIADHLTKAGIAVLRYDDRGIGESTGDFSAATSVDFAGDVVAAVEFLKQHEEIDASKIGLIGHSEGGIVGPMVAANSADIAFVVNLAGPAVNGEEIVVHQSGLIIAASGGSQQDIDTNNRLQRKLAQFIASLESFDDLDEGLEEIYQEHVAELSEEQQQIAKAAEPTAKAQLRVAVTPWFKYFFAHDPAESLRQLSCPVLALYGELDLQVDPKQNLEIARAALQAGNNTDFTIIEFPNTNHLFQTAQTGLVGEYGQIEETIAPRVLDTIRDWILERT